MMTDEELTEELKRIARAGFPWASNNEAFALKQAIKHVIDLVLAIDTPETFTALRRGLEPPEPSALAQSYGARHEG